MPQPSEVPPEPRKGPHKAALTLEQIAKAAVAKRFRRSPTGKLIVPLTIYLDPEVVERLTVRVLREGAHSLAAWVQAVLEREGQDH